jgi:hypothetical protein
MPKNNTRELRVLRITVDLRLTRLAIVKGSRTNNWITIRIPPLIHQYFPSKCSPMKSEARIIILIIRAMQLKTRSSDAALYKGLRCVKLLSISPIEYPSIKNIMSAFDFNEL